MAKQKIVYKLGDQPRNKLEITKEYIQDFYSQNVSMGNIDEKALQSWIDFVKGEEEKDQSAMERFASIRKEFVKRHFPHLDKKSESAYSAYFESLKKTSKS